MFCEINTPKRHGSAFKPLSWAIALSVAATAPLALGESRLEEVLVTAQKREQSLQDVGIAVTAFSGRQLEELGLDKSSDIAMMTPGVHVGGNLAGQNLQFTIRGVAQNDFNDQTESPVAAYIDDTYIAMAQGQRFAMYDLERVEILKGPQGTLFGRNATGGLAHFITRKPNEETGGYVLLEGGDYGRSHVEGAVGGALTDAVNARLSGYFLKNDAYLDNDFTPTGPGTIPPNVSQILLSEGSGDDFGAEEHVALRGQITATLSENVELWVSANYADSDLGVSPYQSEPTAALIDNQGRQRDAIRQPANSVAQAFSYETGAEIMSGVFGPFPRPIPGSDATGYIDPDGPGNDHTSGDFAYDDLNTMTTEGISYKLSWDLGDMDLIYIGDYKNFEKYMGMDVDSAPMNQLTVWFDADVWQVTQELRLQGESDDTRWVAGLYGMHVDYDNAIGFKALDGSPLLLPPGTLPADYPSEVEQETDNYSIFGQIDHDLSDQLTITAGLRVMQEQKDYDYALNVRSLTGSRSWADGILFGTFSDVVGLPVSTAFTDDSSDTLWTGKLQLDWRANDDLLLYAGVNRGVKAGGFNSPIDFGGAQMGGFLSGTPYQYGYKEEVLYAYETGFKATFADGNVRLNGALYYYDYQDYQGFVFAGVSGNVVNYDSEIFGGELELVASPADNLDIMLSIARFDAEVADVEVSPGVFQDSQPSYSPELQYSALVRYGWSMFGGMMAAQADMSYSDSFFYTLRNFKSHEMDDYTIYNARLSWETQDQAWELATFIDNFTDEEYPIMGFDISLFCGCSEIATGTPRWWGVSARRNF